MFQHFYSYVVYRLKVYVSFSENCIHLFVCLVIKLYSVFAQRTVAPLVPSTAPAHQPVPRRALMSQPEMTTLCLASVDAWRAASAREILLSTGRSVFRNNSAAV